MTDHNTQSPKQQEQGVISHGILNVLLVFLESAMTLMLRFNPKLRQLAYPLANEQVVVCVRTYLPHVQFFATFSHHGILLDDALPTNQSAHITINAYSFQLVQVLSNHSVDSVEKLQMRGNDEHIESLKAFLVQLGVGGVIHHLLGKVKKTPQDKPTPEQRADKIGELKTKIHEQSRQIDELKTHNTRLKVQLGEAKTKQKSTFTGFIIASIIAIIALISHFFI